MPDFITEIIQIIFVISIWWLGLCHEPNVIINELEDSTLILYSLAYQLRITF